MYWKINLKKGAWGRTSCCVLLVIASINLTRWKPFACDFKYLYSAVAQLSLTAICFRIGCNAFTRINGFLWGKKVQGPDYIPTMRAPTVSCSSQRPYCNLSRCNQRQVQQVWTQQARESWWDLMKMPTKQRLCEFTLNLAISKRSRSLWKLYNNKYSTPAF